MNFLNETRLANYTTMHLGGPAKVIAEAYSEQDIIDAVAYAAANGLTLLVIGQGSNIIFGDNGFDGLVLINKIGGLLIDSQTGIVRVGAGTNWHDVVIQTVQNGLVGIEAMALIPGTSGATPINNVGAYGQDISGVLVSVQAFDTQTKRFVELTNADCTFSYRNSILKSELYGRYIISSVTLQLKKADTTYHAPKYPALQAELARREIIYPTPEQVMQAVIAIRTVKLPDPRLISNTGSFFKNPIVTKEKALALTQAFPTLPHYPQANGSEKLAAGWLIEAVGLKGHKERGIAVYDKQALVLVNENARSFADLKNMIDKVQTTVLTQFGVTLEPEPEIFAA